MPDLSRLPESVQAQVRERYATLAAKSESVRTPPEELAQAHGDIGLILMATGYYAAAEPSLGTRRRWRRARRSGPTTSGSSSCSPAIV